MRWLIIALVAGTALWIAPGPPAAANSRIYTARYVAKIGNRRSVMDAQYEMLRNEDGVLYWLMTAQIRDLGMTIHMSGDLYDQGDRTLRGIITNYRNRRARVIIYDNGRRLRLIINPFFDRPTVYEYVRL